jgi:hypothetical protein
LQEVGDGARFDLPTHQSDLIRTHYHLPDCQIRQNDNAKLQFRQIGLRLDAFVSCQENGCSFAGSAFEKLLIFRALPVLREHDHFQSASGRSGAQAVRNTFISENDPQAAFV